MVYCDHATTTKESIAYLCCMWDKVQQIAMPVKEGERQILFKDLPRSFKAQWIYASLRYVRHFFLSTIRRAGSHRKKASVLYSWLLFGMEIAEYPDRYISEEWTHSQASFNSRGDIREATDRIGSRTSHRRKQTQFSTRQFSCSSVAVIPCQSTPGESVS